ncbi:MAG TPA: DUF5655 domain-containing protein [Bellilinea sp.]|nr:DUF5655 domain-containing protein [Bellilinea sp.]
MAEIQDWSSMRAMSERLLKDRTGENLEVWNARVTQLNPTNEKSLRIWLQQQGVMGYAQSLLVMEIFGYPAFLTTSADELVNNQYSDRAQLRPIFNATIEAATSLGAVTVQARKTYVSLLTPRRTFARIQPTTRNRIALALRLEKAMADERLVPSRIQETMKWQLGLSTMADLDAEALSYLQQAYEENS